jgi:hypothetical protein
MNPSLKLNSVATDFSQGLSSQLHTLQGVLGSPSFDVTASDYVAEVSRALGVQPPATSSGESQWIAERRAQQRHSIIPVGAKQSHYLDTNGLRTGSDHQSPFSHTYVLRSVLMSITNLILSRMQTPSTGSMHNGNSRIEDRASVPPGVVQPHPVLAPQAQNIQSRGDLAFNGFFTPNNAAQPLGENVDGFAPLSTFLLDPQYMEMDRIISFQDSFMH